MMGLAFAAPPGAVTAETFRRGMRGGFPLAFGVQLGSLIGDATYALLALAGLAAIAQQRTIQLALGAAGALFLLYLAWSSFSTARSANVPGHAERRSLAETPRPWRGSEVSPRLGDHGRKRVAFLSGMTLSLTNPWGIVFWLSLGGALASLGLVDPSGEQVAFFFASFMLGSMAWALILSVAIAKVRHWISPTVFRLITIACGLALGAFGLLVAFRIFSLVFQN